MMWWLWCDGEVTMADCGCSDSNNDNGDRMMVVVVEAVTMARTVVVMEVWLECVLKLNQIHKIFFLDFDS